MSGGLRNRQLYPTMLYRMMKRIDSLLDFVPLLFATRMLVILEKKKVKS